MTCRVFVFIIYQINKNIFFKNIFKIKLKAQGIHFKLFIISSYYLNF